MLVTEKKTIFVTASDKAKLTLLFESAKKNRSRYAAIANLAEELEHMVVTRPEEIPSYVITMHTRFAIKDLDGGEPREYTLVYPGAADYDAGRISIMSPLGAALLGQTPDSLVEYTAPGGVKQVKVVAILHQPEASGDYRS